jgi:hypothetical protein
MILYTYSGVGRRGSNGKRLLHKLIGKSVGFIYVKWQKEVF